MLVGLTTAMPDPTLPSARPGPSPGPRRRLQLGNLAVDVVTFGEALARIDAMITSGQGGTIFTPNVDHVVMVDDDARFRRAYAEADLVVPDGMPIVWASRWLDQRLPEKISGSDLVMPLVDRASRKGWRVYLLGGGDGVAQEVANRLTAKHPKLVIAGVDSPRVDIDESAAQREATLGRVKAARPDLVFVAVGSPKQEIWIAETFDALRPATVIGVGASFDFIAGKARRAPPWMSEAGLEWAFRLGMEPRRLWRRYLLRDPRFLGILLRTKLRAP
jgi:N-acetylglucosaminyldiphosphoundecaprenol N-acetyl-beta-D-mannosaminyltransferase